MEYAAANSASGEEYGGGWGAGSVWRAGGEGSEVPAWLDEEDYEFDQGAGEVDPEIFGLV